MADEFMKGFGILVTAGLGWMTFSGWYNTPSFEGAQLTGASPQAQTIYDTMGFLLRDTLFWFAIIGALTFWVVIPALRQARKAYTGEEEA
jgi:hypothetical protein